MGTDGVGSVERAFRQEVRHFLGGAVPPDIRAAKRAQCLITREQAARWQRILYARGWAAPSWPREHGGPGWSLVQQAIFREELAASDAPNIENLGIDTIGPTLIRHGTEDQCRRFLPGMLSFDDYWAQGYSEPDAGSDLASMRTTARREDDAWIVNGTKIWQSLGHWANWALVLVRTDPGARRKQDGISVLLIDLNSPGVTIRPIRYMNGAHFHVQMFFDDVRVPTANLVGEVNNGWAVAKGLLVIERLFVARVAECKAELAHAAELVQSRCRDSDPDRRSDAAILARRHGKLDIRMRALEAAWWPAVRKAADGGSPELEASLLKIEGIQLLQDLHLFRMDAYGSASLPFDPAAVEGRLSDLPQEFAGNHALHMWRYRGSSLAGGSTEIQREIIAKAIFGGKTELDCPLDNHLSEQQAMMVDSVRRWLDKEYSFERRQEIIGTHGGFDSAIWSGFSGLGLTGLLTPETAGGLGYTAEDLIPLIETAGEALVLEPLIWSATLTTHALLGVPGGVMRNGLLGELTSGEARCVLACDAGTDFAQARPPSFSAHRAGDAWRLDGASLLVMGGAHASHFLVVAQLDHDGLGLFVVPANCAGVSVQGYQLHDGRGAAAVRLDGVHVPVSAMLCGPENTAPIVAEALAIATLALCAETIGVARRALCITVEYLRTRKQFDKALADQQVLRHRIVDHYRAWSGARHLVQHVLSGWHTTPRVERARGLSAAKHLCGTAGRAIALDVLQLHGAIGLQDEAQICHYSKRLIGNDVLLGNASTHLSRFVATTNSVRGILD
ncbi:acyl-CoA dehydrogenase [Burkholderia pseudomallei]|nr:acyl-CoA dehydrogenase [Burkholderia pseudomallei]